MALFSRRHYLFCSSLLAATASPVKTELIKFCGLMFAIDNPQFSTARFVANCQGFSPRSGAEKSVNIKPNSTPAH